MPLDRTRFLELLQRYTDGTCSPDEKKVIDGWYDSLDQRYDEKSSHFSKNELENLLWGKIQQRTASEEDQEPGLKPSAPKWWQSRYFKLATAATILM